MLADMKLTKPQEELLVRLYERPKAIHADYRPMKRLVELSLIRPRDLGNTRTYSNFTYECTTAGCELAQSIKERNAAGK
jgi:metal-sulfur cluster biosynthetic enzyme